MTEATKDIAALMRDMRDLADRIVECQGENSDGEEIIHLYDQSDTTFKAQNILLVLSAFEEQRQRADANAQEIRRLEFQWEHRAPTQWAYDQACTALHAQRESAEKAESEFAKLKGEQAPVAWIRERTIDKPEHNGKVWRDISYPSKPEPAAVDGVYHDVIIPLYDRPQKPVVLPEINEDLVEIIGRPNFTCSGLAELLRRNGADIKRKSENEQAYVIHWLLGIYLKHGIEWRAATESELKSLAAKASAGGIVKDGE